MEKILSAIKTLSSRQMALLVLVLAACALLPFWLSYDIISRDGAFQYIPTARLFVEGHWAEGFGRPQLPLFPLLLAGMSWITGLSLELSGRLISVFCFILAAWGIFRLGEETTGNRLAALLCVVFLVTNRELGERSVDCLKESFLVCLMIWGNLWMLRGVKDHRWGLLVPGLLLLLSGALVRSSALFFVGAWVLVWAFHSRRGLWWRLGLCVLPVAGVFLLWLAAPELPVFRKSFNLGLIVDVVHSPAGLGGALLGTLSSLFGVGNALVMLLVVAGLWRRPWDVYQRHAGWVLVVFVVVLVLMGWTSDRYLLAPALYVCPLAAMVALRTVDRGRLGRGFLGFVLLACLLSWGARAFEGPDPERLARRDSGQWIAAELGPGQQVVTNRERLVFYAEGAFVPLAGVAFNDSMVIAVDGEGEGGAEALARLQAAGRSAQKQFGDIAVYLPES